MDKKKPVIGITGAYVNHNFYMEGVYVHQDYHKSVASVEGLPIILPYINPAIALEMLELCDGLLLSGGEDVDPKFYGQDSHPGLGANMAERDEVEITLAKQALTKKMPILAICRGVQILNVALGGTLIQHIPAEVKNPLQHVQTSIRARDTHWVQVDKGSRLYQILGEERVRVNSLHHQAIAEAAPELAVTARAADGVIEAVEHKSAGFVIGIQWHPESLSARCANMRRIFAEFVKESSCRR